MAEEQVETELPSETNLPAPTGTDGENSAAESEPETLEQKLERLEKQTQELNATLERERARTEKRVSQLARRKNEEMERAFQLQQQLLEYTAPKQAPTLADVGNDPVKYMEAQQGYQKQKEQHEREMQELHNQRTSYSMQDSLAALNERIAEEFGSDAAVLERIQKSQAPVTHDMLDFMAKVPEGAKIADHFARYPNDAAAINSAHPSQRAAMMMQVVGFVRSAGNVQVQQPQAMAVPPVPQQAAMPTPRIPGPPPQAGGLQKPQSVMSSEKAYYANLKQERINGHKSKAGPNNR